jgi:hypothetical protein
MIEHRWLEPAVVGSVFGPPDAEESAEVARHLAECPTCSALVGAIRRDEAAIAAFDAGEPSPSIRRRVLDHAASGGRTGLGPLRLLAFAVLLGAALLGGVAGAGALLKETPADGDPATGPRDLSDLVAGKPIVWKTPAILLAADDVRVEANGRVLRPAAVQSQIHGDPGSLTYATLEVGWAESGVEQRINLYFAADATSWWMTEARAYDNVPPSPDWAMLGGDLLGRQRLGQPFRGDIDLLGLGRKGEVRLRIDGAVLAMSPQRSYIEPPGGGVRLAGDPFAPGGKLRCSGILQLRPADAQREILARGMRLSWRFEWSTGPDTGYADLRLVPPPTGFISSTAVGSDGELIVFVEDPARPMGQRATFPPECGAPPSG